MPVKIIADFRERDDWLKANCEEVWTLDDPEETDDGEKQFYDILLVVERTHEGHDTSHIARIERRYERKTFPDFVKSWREGRLDRQLRIVDALIVEFDPLNVWAEDVPPDDDADMETWMDKRRRENENALKHLYHISKNMEVILSFGPGYTLAILRYIGAQMLEGKGSFEMRPSRLRGRGLSQRQMLLDSLKGINTAKLCADGTTLGSKMEAVADWAGVASALHPEKWPTMDMGEGKTTYKTAKHISLAKAQKVAKALVEGEEGGDEPRQDTSR